MPLRLPELLILFVVALLIFGPKKLPEMASALGRTLTTFRKGWLEIAQGTSEDTEIMDRRAELKRLELEALDREIAAKKATLLTSTATATLSETAEYTSTATYNDSAEEYTAVPHTPIAFNDNASAKELTTTEMPDITTTPAPEGDNTSASERPEDGATEHSMPTYSIPEYTIPTYSTPEQNREAATVGDDSPSGKYTTEVEAATCQRDKPKKDRAEQAGSAS